nr:T9SS type A sorting domain-containing protein [Saprospiraceae bacterium]
AILWSKNSDGRFSFVNGTVVPMSELTTSVESFTSEAQVKAFQRDQKLIIQSEVLSTQANIAIYDNVGKLLLSKNTSGGDYEQIIDISSFQTGVHFIQIGNITQKVMIIK